MQPSVDVTWRARGRAELFKQMTFAQPLTERPLVLSTTASYGVGKLVPITTVPACHTHSTL